MKSVRVLSLFLALVLVLALASCGGSGIPEGFEPIDSSALGPGYSGTSRGPSKAFERTDESVSSGVFAREDGEEDGYSFSYAVMSPHYVVTPEVFRMLFNYVLIKQITPGDGEFDEYDYYFGSGLLDRYASPREQMLPSGKAYWYSDALGSAILICCDALRCFEYAREHDLEPVSRMNELKTTVEIEKIERGLYSEFGGTVEGIFGEGATEYGIYLVLTLKNLSADPTYLSSREDYSTVDDVPITVYDRLSPEMTITVPEGY